MDSIFKIPKLRGSSNYDIWEIRIQAILVEKDYINYILSDYTLNIDENWNPTKEIADKVSAFIKLSLEDGPLLQTSFVINLFIL